MVKIKNAKQRNTTTQIALVGLDGIVNYWQNASFGLLFSFHISSWHYHNLKSFLKFIPACFLNSLEILLQLQ